MQFRCHWIEARGQTPRKQSNGWWGLHISSSKELLKKFHIVRVPAFMEITWHLGRDELTNILLKWIYNKCFILGEFLNWEDAGTYLFRWKMRIKDDQWFIQKWRCLKVFFSAVCSSLYYFSGVGVFRWQSSLSQQYCTLIPTAEQKNSRGQ